jgi:hypothetical protein
MKSLFALAPVVVLAAFFVTPGAAQFGGRSNALGGTATSHVMSHPLGGFAPGFTGSGASRSSRNANSRAPLYGYPFAYSVWVPDYFDYVNNTNQYAAPYGYPPQSGPGPDAPQQPVIINQYFGAPDPGRAGPQQSEAPPPDPNNTSAQVTGDPIGSPQNYYLIAYKNHAVYSALAYWVEDKTLHYVTTQNTHNQASLDLIDLALTKSLNQRNDVPFSIPGQ